MTVIGYNAALCLVGHADGNAVKNAGFFIGKRRGSSPGPLPGAVLFVPQAADLRLLLRRQRQVGAPGRHHLPSSRSRNSSMVMGLARCSRILVTVQMADWVPPALEAVVFPVGGDPVQHAEVGGKQQVCRGAAAAPLSSSGRCRRSFRRRWQCHRPGFSGPERRCRSAPPG